MNVLVFNCGSSSVKPIFYSLEPVLAKNARKPLIFWLFIFPKLKM